MRFYYLFSFCFLFHLYSFSHSLAEAVQTNTQEDSVSLFLDEIEVSATQQKKAITGTLSGKIELQAEAMSILPKFLGDADPIRTMQLIPGIQTTGELNSGIYIRGGDPGHNLILINDAPIYNPMHLMGFFSIFNTNHFSRFTLLKSNIGPEYGGRVGGVLSMTTKNSLADKFSVSGSVGLIASQLTISTPITKKTALYASARKTYLNLYLGLINNSEDDINLKYDFQDYNLTYVYQPSSPNKLVVNGYFGSDLLNIGDVLYQISGDINWYNIASSVQWSYTPSEKRELNQTVFFSRYENKIELDQDQIKIQLLSDISDVGYKGSYRFEAFRCEWTAGIDYTYHLTHPQYPSTTDLFGISKTESLPFYRNHEIGAYLNLRKNITEKFTIDAGLRYSGWFQSGKENNNVANNDNAGEKFENFHGGFEPRFSFTYNLRTNQRIILSYGLFRQYMNQVAVSEIGFPTDFWVPTYETIKPQSSNSFSGGYYQSFLNDAYEFSGDLYYRSLRNQPEFDGEMLDMINQNYVIEDRILYGKGWTYGGELMIKKNRGKLTGWISYALGWSWREFSAINDGKPFPATHDRRHDFSIVTNYAINNKWDFSIVWVYASGIAITMPEAMYLIGESAINEYGVHNGDRMPDYHRMDISVNYWFKKNKDRESGLNFSIYNVYARKNPVYLSVKVRKNDDNDKIRIFKSGKELYSLIPSISYMFKF